MSLAGASQFYERIQFFNGQRLFASDLQALESFHREMRWLHNQSLHAPGVGSGFAITGAKGDRQVVIGPGYALDDLGREIVLTETHIEPVPPIANDGFGRSVLYDLTVAYSDKDLKESETREGVCQEIGAVRLREEPVFCWMRLGPPPDHVPERAQLRSDLQTGRRIRLARAEVLNCQLDQPLSLAQRRNARPPSRPYVASGSTDSTSWTVAKGSKDTFGFGYEISRSVSTTSASFRNTPSYMASVRGQRQFAFLGAGGVNLDAMLDGFLSISAPLPDSFQLSVLLPQVFFDKLANITADEIAKQLKDKVSQPLPSPAQPLKGNQWEVDWIGVEG